MIYRVLNQLQRLKPTEPFDGPKFCRRELTSKFHLATCDDLSLPLCYQLLVIRFDIWLLEFDRLTSVYGLPSFANNPSSGHEVRLLTYIRSYSAAPVPVLDPDGLFAR